MPTISIATDQTACIQRETDRGPSPVPRPQLPLAQSLRRIDGTRTYTNWGLLSAELEQRLADHFGLGHRHDVVSASSGTAALTSDSAIERVARALQQGVTETCRTSPS